MKLSYWEKEVFFKDIDIIVLGSGLVGLSTAINIKENAPHLRVIILERGVIPSGASTRNAGFACFGSVTELLDDLKHRSETEVLDLVAARWEGLQKLKERLKAYDFDYQGLGGYELFLADEAESYAACKDILPYLNDKIASVTSLSRTYQLANHKISSFGFEKVEHLIHNIAEGQIHTGKMMYALLDIAKNLNIPIFNGIEITNFESNADGVSLLSSNGWEIQSKQMIVATNGFSNLFFKDIDLKPARNQVLITKPIPNLSIKGTFHYQAGYYYFRNIENRILFGGGRNIALEEETTSNFGITAKIQENLLGILEEVILPNVPFEIDRWWSGILGVGEQKSPIIEWVRPNVLTAIRLGGMGVAIGTLVGERAAKKMLTTL